jgi:hypothetical protein
MVYQSPLSTPDQSPLRVHLIDSSTPWSDVLLDERAIHISFSPIPIGRFNHVPSVKTQLRRCYRPVWLALLLVLGWVWFWMGGKQNAAQSQNRINLSVPNIEGLQFIDVSHPEIRV